METNKKSVMPPRRGKKNYRKKPARKGRSFRKRPSRKYKSAYKFAKGKSAAPFPLVLNKTLTYAEEPRAIIQATTGFVQPWEFRGNSLYDPDLTYAGGQPRYFDSICGADTSTAPYYRYRVIASKIDLDIYPDPTLTSSNNLGIAYVVPILSGTASVDEPGKVLEVCSRPFVKWVAMGNTGDKCKYRLSSYMTTRRITGGQDTRDTDLSAIYNGNPTTVWKWSFGIFNLQTGGIYKCIVVPRITYYCQFFDLNDVADS